MRYLFGPVLSRRLGRSLGIDLTPAKICTLDCVYCQVRATEEHTAVRRALVPAEEVIAEARAWFASGGEADAVTFAGSGEPTLHAQLGEMIRAIKSFSPCRVAVITNGTLLHDAALREELLEADLVMPNVDAGDEATFARLNRPAPGIALQPCLAGLAAFAAVYRGLLPIEVFLVPGYNTGEAELRAIARAIAALPRHDGIEINFARRPAHRSGIALPSEEELARAARILGEAGRVVELPAAPALRPEDAAKGGAPGGGEATRLDGEELVAALARHPATATQLAASFRARVATVEAALAPLTEAGRVVRDPDGYFKVK